MEIESILDSIKIMLGVDAEDTNFDRELIIFINGALMIMYGLGVRGTPYSITDKTNTWGDFLGERKDLELVKTAVYFRVRLVFDPPQNSFLVEAIKEQSKEAEWYIENNHIVEESV